MSNDGSVDLHKSVRWQPSGRRDFVSQKTQKAASKLTEGAF